jgi:predicted  nucleic acid-binding Zn-ribbon protein
MNKMAQDLKIEIGTIKKSQVEVTLEMENLGRRTGDTESRVIKRIEEMEEKISDIEDNIEEMDISSKEKF